MTHIAHVMACLDGSQSSEPVCDYAVWAAQRLDVPLDFLHVVDRADTPATAAPASADLGVPPPVAEEQRLLEEAGRAVLEAARARAAALGIAAPGVIQQHGEVLDVLLEREGDIRLLVMGRHGRIGDASGERLGAHVGDVVRVLHRPVLVVAGPYRLPQRIMIAFDDTPTTRKVVETVAASRLFRGLPCHVVMVGGRSAEAASQFDWARRILTTAGYEVNGAILAGDPVPVLSAYCTQHAIDMVVMGAYTHSRLREYLVGSTTEGLMRQSQVPLVLLR